MLSDAVLKAPNPLFKMIFRHMGQTFAGTKISVWSFSRFRATERSEEGPTISDQYFLCNKLSLTSEKISVTGVNKINISRGM